MDDLLQQARLIAADKCKGQTLTLPDPTTLLLCSGYVVWVREQSLQCVISAYPRLVMIDVPAIVPVPGFSVGGIMIATRDELRSYHRAALAGLMGLGPVRDMMAAHYLTVTDRPSVVVGPWAYVKREPSYPAEISIPDVRDIVRGLGVESE